MSRSKPRIISYILPGEWIVLAGASDADNDYLSTTLAEPNDWWFHAEGVPGSHVILRAKPDEEPDRETLLQTASIAAYHSKARKAKMVQVHQTRARNVRKSKGLNIGTVEVSRGKVLKVHPDISFATRIPWRKLELSG